MRYWALATFAHAFHEDYLLFNVICAVLVPAVIAEDMSTRRCIKFYFIRIAVIAADGLYSVRHCLRIVPVREI